MRNPLPTNRLVALTLVGALATAVVASALIVPGVIDTSADTSGATPTAAGSDAPQPNQNFTAAVSNGNDGRGGEYEAHEEEEEYEDHEEEEEEYEEHEEHE
ncbi:hypothetical protein ACFR9U_09540 [Halorientalis brevis]|uniref:Uncharacterized protein n=1 Tax=Halorientalis brevis TaxID=1126241 RepID=A0ABD6CB33_9EURY|nr:hypothetical protein [Halorientalis brevis]